MQSNPLEKSNVTSNVTCLSSTANRTSSIMFNTADNVNRGEVLKMMRGVGIRLKFINKQFNTAFLDMDGLPKSS